MSQVKNDLSVRQHQRYQCNLGARVRLESVDALAVKLSPAASASADALDVRVTDASRGGLGLSSEVYLPPGCRLVVTVEVEGKAREYQTRVQRVRMTDRRPTYYIGTSFSGSSPEQAAHVEALLAERARAEVPRA